MAEFVTIDHAGVRTPLRYLLRSSGLSVVLLHESAGVVEQYLKKIGNISDIIFVLSWSWYFSEEKAPVFRRFMDQLCAEFPSQAASIRNNVIFAMNSASETLRFREWAPGCRVVHVNNTALLSEHEFRIQDEEPGDFAVMNAKPLLFKRHYLTRQVPRKVFISYGEEGSRKNAAYADLRNYGALDVFWDLPAWKVMAITNAAFCGLMLSEMEGACYASTEYLLCGIPVVSTVSLGGRDDFYTPNNAIIVDPDPAAVAAAVATFRQRARSGDIDRAALRDAALERQRGFRDALAEELARASGGSQRFFSEMIGNGVRRSNKLAEFKNFWVKTLESAVGEG